MPSIMQRGVTESGDSPRARRRFYRTALLTVIGLCECQLAVPASAEFVTGIPNTLPAVGAANGFTAVRYTGSGSATAAAHTFPFESAGDGFGGTNTDFLDGSTDMIESGTDEFVAIATTRDSQTIAVADARAGLGKLGASATMQATNTLTNGTAKAVAEWIDLIARDPNDGGILNAGGSFDVKVDVSGSLSANVGAGSATVHAQLWIFPFNDGTLPQPFAPINAQYYREIYKEAAGFTLNTTVGDLATLPVGMQFWAYARLAVFASVMYPSGQQPNFPELVNNSHSQYSNTFEMFIDPSPDTPWARLSGATGFDYRTPVPEPASVALALGALLAGIGGNRIRRRRH